MLKSLSLPNVPCGKRPRVRGGPEDTRELLSRRQGKRRYSQRGSNAFWTRVPEGLWCSFRPSTTNLPWGPDEPLTQPPAASLTSSRTLTRASARPLCVCPSPALCLEPRAIEEGEPHVLLPLGSRVKSVWASWLPPVFNLILLLVCLSSLWWEELREREEAVTEVGGRCICPGLIH